MRSSANPVSCCRCAALEGSGPADATPGFFPYPRVNKRRCSLAALRLHPPFFKGREARHPRLRSGRCRRTGMARAAGCETSRGQRCFSVALQHAAAGTCPRALWLSGGIKFETSLPSVGNSSLLKSMNKGTRTTHAQQVYKSLPCVLTQTQDFQLCHAREVIGSSCKAWAERNATFTVCSYVGRSPR